MIVAVGSPSPCGDGWLVMTVGVLYRVHSPEAVRIVSDKRHSRRSHEVIAPRWLIYRYSCARPRRATDGICAYALWVGGFLVLRIRERYVLAVRIILRPVIVISAGLPVSSCPLFWFVPRHVHSM